LGALAVANALGTVGVEGGDGGDEGDEGNDGGGDGDGLHYGGEGCFKKKV